VEVVAVGEREILESLDPVAMLKVLQRTPSDRKLRLFAVACCRRAWHLLSKDGSKKAIDAAERYADGISSLDELRTAHQDAIEATWELRNEHDTNWRAQAAAEAAEMVSWANADGIGTWIDDGYSSWIAAAEALSGFEETGNQRELLWDIFGSVSFRPITIDARWLTSSVADLATAIYAERAFDRIPILADALMDAGCDSEEVIAHCRGNAHHVRGCWLLDLLLGKS
jgi:hypothetical protein